MTDFSVQEVLEMAIQTEKLGAEFYSTIAEKFQDKEDLKTLFEMLAVKEKEHEKIFHAIMEKSDSINKLSDNWEEAAKYMRAIVESEFFLGDNKALPDFSYLETVRDAVNYAITFEKVTLLYYLELRNIVNDKEALNDLINEEKKHIVWLSDYRNQLWDNL